ncbi:hypothetical protein [Mycolicibacterium porcinum]|uniref:hypothetical protein n=1 Tax=Mycolicibacterium porcinum TaxID=39693 RepID=UPI000848CE5E|nr:hypothetical protein [Mycolicibacterium porcinum]ODR17602.1 hypothetical protein BHQ19_28605 [Mycolicibacterium porcinum]
MEARGWMVIGGAAVLVTGLGADPFVNRRRHQTHAVRLEGRRLRPWLELRRDQAFQWFEIRPDDTVRSCDAPD